MVLDEETVARFRQDGFVKVRGFIDRMKAEHLREALLAEAEAYDRGEREGDPRYTFARHKTLFEISNLWKILPELTDFTLHRRVAHAVAELMGVGRVRLYQDALLLKTRRHSSINLHQDENFTVLDKPIVTAWIALVDVDENNGALCYARGSQVGGLVDTSGQSHEEIRDDLAAKGFSLSREHMQQGDVLFHDGKVFHASEPNRTDTPRVALSMFWFADGARLCAPFFGNRRLKDVTDRIYFPDRAEGDLADTPLNPLCYDENRMCS